MVEINLLPWRQRLQAWQEHQFLWMVIFTSVAMLLLIITLYFALIFQIKKTESRVGHWQQAREQIAKSVAMIHQLEDQKNKHKQEINFLQTLEAQHAKQVAALNAMPVVIPKLAYLTEFALSETAINLIGFAESPAVVAEFFNQLTRIPSLRESHMVEVKKVVTAGVMFRVETFLTTGQEKN